jgi:DNA-binding YbaB/EbfC family protein
MMNPLEMMRQAQQLQERLQKEMSSIAVEGVSGGGMVTVVVNGHKHVQKLTIDPEVVSKDDVQMLQDLIAAAVNDALRKVDDELKSRVGGMIGGLGLPGF